MLEKQNLHLEQERIDALHAAYEKQDAATVAALQQEQVIEEISRVLDCNYTVEPYQSELATLLRSGNDALDWYMQHSQYDGLFILQSQAMGDLNRILVDFLFIERTTLLDRLVQYGSYRSLSKELDAHMFRLLGSPDQGALCFEQGIRLSRSLLTALNIPRRTTPFFFQSENMSWYIHPSTMKTST